MAIYEEREIKPLVKIDEYLALRTPIGKEKYFRVVRIEPIPGYRDDFKNYIAGFTSLPPGQKTKVVEEDAKKILAVRDRQLLQYRLIPIDDYVYRYLQYGDRFTLKNKDTYIDKESIELCPQIAEWFVYEENVPTIEIYNPGTESLTNLRFRLIGFLYELEEVKTKPPKVTYIPVYFEV